MSGELGDNRTGAILNIPRGEHQPEPARDADVQDAQALGAIPGGCTCRWVPDPLAIPARLTSLPDEKCRVHGAARSGK